MSTATGRARIQPTRRRLKPVTGGKGKLYQFRQPSTKKFGNTGSQVPVPQQLRMIEKYMRGTSIRQIAEEEDRARQTVTKVVRAPEVQGYIEKLREQVIALGDEMVKSVQFALRNELDGQLAYAMLKDIGVMQPGAQEQLNGQLTEDQWNLEWMRRLDVIALERHRVYGVTLPPHLKELGSAMDAEEAKHQLISKNENGSR